MLFLYFISCAFSIRQQYFQYPTAYLGQNNQFSSGATGSMSQFGYPYGGMWEENEYSWEKVYDDLNMDDWFDNDLFESAGGMMANAMTGGNMNPFGGNIAFNNNIGGNSAYNNNVGGNSAYNNVNNVGGNSAYNNNVGGNSAFDNDNLFDNMFDNVNDAERPAASNPALPANPFPSYAMYGYGSPMFYDYDSFNNDWWDVWDDAGNSPRVCKARAQKNECHGQTSKGHCIWNMERDSCTDCSKSDNNCLCTRFDKAHGQQYCIQNRHCAWSKAKNRCLAKDYVTDPVKPASKNLNMVDTCSNFFDNDQCFGIQADGRRCFWNAYDGECVAHVKAEFDKGMCGIHASPKRCMAEWRGGIHFSCTFNQDQCVPKSSKAIHGGHPVTSKQDPRGHPVTPVTKSRTAIHGGHPWRQQGRKLNSVHQTSENHNALPIVLCVLLGISAAFNTVAAYHFCNRSKQVGLLEDVTMH